MALLPDLAAAGLYAAVVFLLVLGFLVVFVESVRVGRLLVLVVTALAAAAILALAGEGGVALVVAGVGLALVTSLAFEWLTTR